MTIKTFQWIVNKLPYSEPFLFVDEILNVGEKSSEGIYTFKPDAAFYKGHFKDNPVTPGVLLTECCAQIGLVSLGIYLLGEESKIEDLKIGMSSSQMEFLLPVFPGERVRVQSELIYFRFHKLKCNVKMYNEEGKLVCKGILAGMIGVNNE
ncbi:FabA/FabZ family ACP-dehydratase [uncultured Maribacter sp.]|uniref:3-hydroxyacyl-ACP dehydratase FabZ family protein n=1 Tax=uncultured Maribacter sp. TaxID=431308 RepID=UPI0030DABE6A|tara:strand:- start:1474 stop:1926 length:453 start_codon:yes stop_codon:yes gene_type:complete